MAMCRGDGEVEVAITVNGVQVFQKVKTCVASNSCMRATKMTSDICVTSPKGSSGRPVLEIADLM